MRSMPLNRSNIKARGMAGMRSGFSLGEMLAAMTIGAMVLVAVLTIYNRAERSAVAVTRSLDISRTPRELLQRIAEDIDRMISSGSDAQITIQNKYDHLFPTARLVMSRTYKDRADRDQKFEEIVWQTSYDFESLGDGLVLYRSHSGVGTEDKVLDKNKSDWEKELFVPLCGGVTFFKIRAIKAEKYLDIWNGSPPPGIEVAISFAEPYKKVDGTLDVLDEQKIVRTVAPDRTRKITFKVPADTTGAGQDQTAGTDGSEAEEQPPVSPGTTPKKPEQVKR